MKTLNLVLLWVLVSLSACSGGSSKLQQPKTITFTTVETIAGQVGVRGSKDGTGREATFNDPVGLAATGAAVATKGEVLLSIAALNESIR